MTATKADPAQVNQQADVIGRYAIRNAEPFNGPHRPGRGMQRLAGFAPDVGIGFEAAGLAMQAALKPIRVFAEIVQ